MAKIKAKEMEITVSSHNDEDYLWITDIAFEFASWISVEFKTIITEVAMSEK